MRGLWFAASGTDNIALMRAVGAWEYFTTPPQKVVLDYRSEKKGSASWADVAAKCKTIAQIIWDEAAGKLLSFTPGKIHQGALGGVVPEYPVSVEGVLAAFAALPVELATLQSPFEELHKIYRAPGFGDHQGPLGWGCLFKGAGHDRLVSRRWLEHGPWRLLRGPNDTTLVQFHALDATMEQAIEQAREGHQRMGITDTGGFIQTGYVYAYKPDGLYVAADRSLRILINGRDVSQREMLDAAAYGRLHRDVAEQPIASVRFVFVDGEPRARQHLHEIWLRGLECWAVVDGVEKRLDTDYQPGPSPARADAHK
ncbi:MAG: hypothetical protein IPQ07_21845 [Myxococcales bacterium]|nr:hypothetical protein [Myxococcales bacterium]